MGVILGVFVLETAVVTAVSFFAARISLVKIDLLQMLVIILLVSCISWLPDIGWIAGVVLFVYLLHRATKDGVVDCLWVALLSKPVCWGVLLGLSSMLPSLARSG